MFEVTSTIANYIDIDVEVFVLFYYHIFFLVLMQSHKMTAKSIFIQYLYVSVLRKFNFLNMLVHLSLNTKQCL